MNRIVTIFTALAGAAFVSIPHPHGKLPLWTYTQRARRYLDGKAGNMTIAALDAAFLNATDRASSRPAPGTFAKHARLWAERGQVDLLGHLLDLGNDAAVDGKVITPHLRMCEICRVFAHDAIFNDPPSVRATPPGKNGILPITAHNFLVINRDFSKLGFDIIDFNKAASAKPAFFSDTNIHKSNPADIHKTGIEAIDSAVRRKIGFLRFDLDGDGSAETEALDLDDDGKFEIYHVDRNRDGAFELEASRGEDGKWKITESGALLDAHQRALEAFQQKFNIEGGPESAPSGAILR